MLVVHGPFPRNYLKHHNFIFKDDIFVGGGRPYMLVGKGVRTFLAWRLLFVAVLVSYVSAGVCSPLCTRPCSAVVVVCSCHCLRFPCRVLRAASAPVSFLPA